MIDAPTTSRVAPSQGEENGNSGRFSDRVAQDLRRLIVSLELAPGTPIIEGDLMKRLSCGRTPLREALQRLAGEYLIRVVPRRGMNVSEIGVSELRQVYEVRYGLEGLITSLAAERITGRQLEDLNAVTRRIEDAGESAGLYETVLRDTCFHLMLADASGNQYLRDAFVRLSGLAARLMYFAHSHGQPIAQTYIEHDHIIEALRSRDPESAQRAVQTHIRQAKERILRTLIA